MIGSTAPMLTRFKYAATLVGALAVVVLAPATAHATDNDDPTNPGGCHYTDADGYDIPIDNGQDVFVDGKIVSCRGETITVTTAPKSGVGGVRPQLGDSTLPVLTEAGPNIPQTPRRPAQVNQNVSVFTAAPSTPN